MGLLRRSPASPPETTSAVVPDARLKALGGGKVLARVALRGGGTAAATVPALVMVATADPTATDEDQAVTVPWELTDGAEWLADSATLLVRALDGAEHRLPLPDGERTFPQVVRERVEASIVHVQTRDLGRGVTVRAAVRRSASGDLSSQVTVLGAATRTAAIDRAGEELEREVRSAVGLPA